MCSLAGQHCDESPGERPDADGATSAAGSPADVAVSFAEQLRALDFEIDCHRRGLAFAERQGLTATARVTRRDLAALVAARETVAAYAARVAAVTAELATTYQSAAAATGSPESSGGGGASPSPRGAAPIVAGG